MTTTKKIARRKLSLLQLAQEMNNISKACRLMGYSRQQFYEIRRNYQTYGAEGLIDRLPGARGPHPNRVSPEVEQAILAHCLEYPTQGCLRVAQELALQGVQVSSGGVRGVWEPASASSAIQARTPAALRATHSTAARQAERSADPTPRAILSRVPRSPHPDPPYRRATRRRHLLRGHPQRSRTGLHADGHRLPQPLCLGAAVYQQAAGNRRAIAQ